MNLKQWRKQRRLSQADLASILGVHRTTIARWESGECEPSKAAAAKLAQFKDYASTVASVLEVEFDGGNE